MLKKAARGRSRLLHLLQDAAGLQRDCIRQRADRADLADPIQSVHDIPLGIARPGGPAHPGVPALSNDLHAMLCAKPDSNSRDLFRRGRLTTASVRP